MATIQQLKNALRESRTRANQDHGLGAWDVADVMAVLDALGITLRLA